MTRTLRLAALAVVGALLLSGCMRSEVDISLHEDDTMSGTMTVEVLPGSGQYTGETDQEFLDEATRNLPVFARGDTEFYESGEYVGKRVRFTEVPIASAGTALPLTTLEIVRDGDEFRVDGTFDLSNGAEDGIDRLEPGDLSLRITFPGDVTDHTGTLEGRTVTWDLTQIPVEIHAVGGAVAPDGGPSRVAIGAIIAVGLGGVLSVLAWLALRRGRRMRAATAD